VLRPRGAKRRLRQEYGRPVSPCEYQPGARPRFRTYWLSSRCGSGVGSNAATPLERTPQALPRFLDAVATRVLDLLVSAVVLVLLLPAIACLAAAIKLDSPGPVFFRCRRVGRYGSDLAMLKFRKMPHDAAGPALTVAEDTRFTRVGRLLAASKLDEIPQLWNVLKGEMSLVGPRPEDRRFVDFFRAEYTRVLQVKPGITGFCQLAFAREGEILDPANRLEDYVERLLPQKVELDRLYVSTRSFWRDVRILAWTSVALILRRDVAVHRDSGRLSVRRRISPSLRAALPPETPEVADGLQI
jgi:lipopolysaccharide/colanic/teichoic acid biosynthesis glycosyltransferase